MHHHTKFSCVGDLAPGICARVLYSVHIEIIKFHVRDVQYSWFPL